MSKYLCPVCRAPRKSDLKDDLPFSSHLKIFISVGTIVSLSYLVGSWDLAWRTAFLYLPFWAISEFIHWVKMREAAKCFACGFDPILYQRDWRAARHQIENRMGHVIEELKNQGRFIPSKMRQYAPQGQAQSANTEAVNSKPQTLSNANKASQTTKNVQSNKLSTTRAVAASDLPDDQGPEQGKLF